MTVGIYKIALDDGRCYVGQSIEVEQRFRHHRNALRRGDHRAPYLQHAWNKYGEDAFAFELLEECDVRVLTAREQWWMDSLSPALNTLPIAGARPKGTSLTEEHKARIAAAHRGKKASPATRAILSAAHMGVPWSAARRETENRRQAARAMMQPLGA